MRTLRNAVEQRPRPPRLPVRGLARHGQDVAREDPRPLAELRQRPDRDARAGSASPAARSPPGTSLDVIEMDAASNRSVDDIRDLRERVGYAPAAGRWKVYILDEAHMLTREAWNAFLKTLEEPPPQHRLRALHDRAAQGDAHDRRPLPALRLPAPVAGADRRRSCGASPPPSRSRSTTAPWRRSRARPRGQLPRRARDARPARRLQRQAGRDRRRARGARRRRGGADPGRRGRDRRRGRAGGARGERAALARSGPRRHPVRRATSSRTCASCW